MGWPPSTPSSPDRAELLYLGGDLGSRHLCLGWLGSPLSLKPPLPSPGSLPELRGRPCRFSPSLDSLILETQSLSGSGLSPSMLLKLGKSALDFWGGHPHSLVVPSVCCPKSPAPQDATDRKQRAAHCCLWTAQVRGRLWEVQKEP